MSLSRKLAQLEVMIRAKAPATPTFWTDERLGAYRAWAERLLDGMPFDRARRAFDELTTLPVNERRRAPAARQRAGLVTMMLS